MDACDNLSRHAMLCCAVLCCGAEDLLSVRSMVSKQLQQLTGNLELAIQHINTHQQQSGPASPAATAGAAKAGSLPGRSRSQSPKRKGAATAAAAAAAAGGSGGGRQQWRYDDTYRQHDVDPGRSAAAAAALEGGTIGTGGQRAGAMGGLGSNGSNAARPLFAGSNGGTSRAIGQSNCSGSDVGGSQEQQQGRTVGAAAWSPGNDSRRGRVVSPARVRASPGSRRGVGGGVISSSVRGSTDSWHGVWKPAGVASAAKGPLSPVSPVARAATWGGGGVRGAGGGLGARGSTNGTGRGLNDAELESVLRLLGSIRG